MSTDDSIQGVQNCYLFKSRLQEYVQKVGLPSPVYETIKEGPSHVPSFRSTVIVNDVRYDSLPGFFHRKAAEQSAAEVALRELGNNGKLKECISQPAHETGLCKNLLQEYAQKMNYGIPSYKCQKEKKPGNVHFFSCSIEIGGIKYIGSAARTKKEAEISAARTAILAFQSNECGPFEVPTVVPCKKKATDSGISTQETIIKPKKQKKKRRLGDRGTDIKVGGEGNFEANIDHNDKKQLNQTGAAGIQVADSGNLSTEAIQEVQAHTPSFNENEDSKHTSDAASVVYDDGDAEDGELTVPMDFHDGELGISDVENPSGEDV
ncbi:double-stranded RNA-binding protein 1-like [Diospyros lotus]|uniref:double-stranded RNA-binding protein 1-like n=1 Tax=Diospyros lotus TaxID=55363 RepID=UPI0022503FEC|nr:double-stranded RNA-binding protein 1-like [Diospyros lotus]